MCWSALPKPTQHVEGKDEPHLLSEAHGVHRSPYDVSLFSFEALKLGKRMELGRTRKIPFFPNFSGTLGTFRCDRKRSQKRRPWRSPAGSHGLFSWPKTTSLCLSFLSGKRSWLLTVSSALCPFGLAISHQLFPLPSPGCNYLNVRQRNFPILETLHIYLSLWWPLQCYIVPSSSQKLSLSSFGLRPMLDCLLCLASWVGYQSVLEKTFEDVFGTAREYTD